MFPPFFLLQQSSLSELDNDLSKANGQVAAELDLNPVRLMRNLLLCAMGLNSLLCGHHISTCRKASTEGEDGSVGDTKPMHRQYTSSTNPTTLDQEKDSEWTLIRPREEHPLEPEQEGDTMSAGDVQRQSDVLSILPSSHPLIFQHCLQLDQLVGKPEGR